MKTITTRDKIQQLHREKTHVVIMFANSTISKETYIAITESLMGIEGGLLRKLKAEEGE